MIGPHGPAAEAQAGPLPIPTPPPHPAIRLFVMDVDGTLTDGTITYSEDGTESKSFHSKDGLGIKLLPRAGIRPAIVSGRTSAVVVRRARELGIEEVHQGIEDKVAAVADLRRRHALEPGQVAFVGDDLSDLAAMRGAGFSAAPADAVPEVRRHATHVCSVGGGRGAVREAIEVLLRRMGVWDEVLREHGADVEPSGRAR